MREHPADLSQYVFDLPRPPSVNRFVGKLGNKSPAVVEWIAQCDRFVMATAPRPYPHLKGPFEIEVIWSVGEFGRADIDNPVKPLLDYMQRIEMIENDRYCRELVVRFGEAPAGCRVALRQWTGGHDVEQGQGDHRRRQGRMVAHQEGKNA